MRYRDKLNPASVLLTIREGEAVTIGALLATFVPRDLPPSLRSRMHHELKRTLFDLEAAGLVHITDGVLSVSEGLDAVQRALGISLTELSSRTQHSTLVSPLFGSTEPSSPVPDVFVLMPFEARLRPVYEDHIKHVSESLGLSVGRADDFFAAESIVAGIWQAIFNCKVIVADCTGKNPNVFYEIGIAHTVGKRTVVISQNIDDIPFDLRHLRCIVYDYTPRGMASFNDALGKTLTTEIGRAAG